MKELRLELRRDTHEKLIKSLQEETLIKLYFQQFDQMSLSEEIDLFRSIPYLVADGLSKFILPWEEGEQFVDPNYLYINETQRSGCEELLNRYFYSHEAIAYWMKVKNNISTTLPSHGDSEYINKFEKAYEPIWIRRNLCNGLFDSEAWNDSEEWACKCFKCPQRAWFYFSMAVLADNFIEIR